MTSPKELIKGRCYRLPGTEFDHMEFFKRSDGTLGWRPIFKFVVFSEKATYGGRFDMGDERSRCNACHRWIRRGYEFTNADDQEEKLHFGRCCLMNHVDIPDEELIREAEE